MNEESRLIRSETIHFQVVDNQAILLNPETGKYYSLNKVGTRFWLQLDGDKTLMEHARLMVDYYGVSQERILNDLLALAEELLDKEIAVLAGI